MERQIKRGDVYYVRYDSGVGSEEAVGRPVIIVSSQEGIDSSPVLQVIYMSTNSNKQKIKVNVPIYYLQNIYIQLDIVHTRQGIGR